MEVFPTKAVGAPKVTLPTRADSWKGGSFRHFCAKNRSVPRRKVVALRSLLSYLPASLATKSLLGHLPASLGTVHKSRNQVGGGRFFAETWSRDLWTVP